MPRRLVAPVARPLRRAAVGFRTRGWPPHSRLFLAYDVEGWVLEYEARQLERTALALGVATGSGSWVKGVDGQSIFHLSQFTLLLHDFERRENRLGFAYFHGRPGTPGMPEFDACFETLRRRHAEIDRVQVTSSAMEELILETGIAAEKLHRIPIGIDTKAFRRTTPEGRAAARRALGLPESAFVVGSFQKDGVGWGDGLEPKLIKGPDVLLAVAERLRERIPELFFLLTGPSRGYVRAGLERLGVPYRHALLPSVDAVAQGYEAIDVCLVTSRDEGGPRAVLEAMATGVPLVTTRVGQAIDLVRHGENGWLADVEDVAGLVEWTAHVAEAPAGRQDEMLAAGEATAAANAYETLRPRWRELFRGFVAMPELSGGEEMDLSIARAARYARAGTRWARLLVRGRPTPGIRVFYGHDQVPAPGDRAAGGTAKAQKLSERFPSSSSDFSILYLGSTWLPRDLGPLLRLARRRSIPVVLNQDGVAYPGWAGEMTDALNRPLRSALLAADHVLYQSEFSKHSADLFLGEPVGSWEVLRNAVDVSQFTPAENPAPGGPVLLLGGDQTQAYRLELALRTLAALLPRHPDARLLVTGRLVSPVEPLVAELGLRDRVELVGEYAQRDAPALFRRAHLLLHTKVLDPCPTLVLEAMATGLPVVYPASGGTVELVGDEAGVGVPHPQSWERDEPPSPQAFAHAVDLVLADLAGYAARARARAVERFLLEPWLDRHSELFSELVSR